MRTVGEGGTINQDSYGATSIPAALGAFQAFPVGAVFISVVSTNPATLLGYGTWSAFGTGRFLVGIDSGNAAWDTVEETGGSVSYTPAGSNSAPAFTGDAASLGGTISWPVGVPTQAADTFSTQTVSTTGATAVLKAETANGAISWPAGVPTISMNAYTPTGTVGAPTFTGTPATIVPPYIAVYMWKRVS